MNRTSSAAAHRDNQSSGLYERTTLMILNELAKHPGGTSRRNIEECTGLRANQVAGRVNELIEQKRIEESAHKYSCPVTGRKVFFVTLPGEEQ